MTRVRDVMSTHIVQCTPLDNVYEHCCKDERRIDWIDSSC